MSDFIVPKNKDYTFTVRVMEKDSFLPQDLTNMVSATIEFTQLELMCGVFSTVMTVIDYTADDTTTTLLSTSTDSLSELITGAMVFDVDNSKMYTFVPADEVNVDLTLEDFTDTSRWTRISLATNGELRCTLLAADTNLLEVVRGDAVDEFYPKPSHQALITITFSDSTPTVFTQVPAVSVIPTGC